jgi:hypothetical protein
MRRSLAVGLVCAVGFGLAACASDDKIAGPPNAPPTAGPQVAPTPGTCVDYQTLYNQVAGLFANSSPDQNAALGKLNNMKHQVDIQNFDAAKAQAFNVVDFILLKFKQGSIVASEADLIAAVNNIFCFAGLALTLGDGNNSWIVYPSDTEQILTTEDEFAATALPGGVVDEPTLVAITRLTGIFGPGEGPLATALDQYPLPYLFSQQSEHNNGFLAPVVVGVCAANGIPTEVFNRLRLGHGLDASTSELTPEADPPATLNCANAPSLAEVRGDVLPAWLRGLGEMFLPKKAYAFRAGGGVGGSAEEFSPFAPVDPQTDMSGGVGGSAGEFLRLSPVISSVVSCPPVTAPVGGDVDAACRPEVTLMTPLYKAWLDGGQVGPQQGNLLTGVPVEFVVEAGGGSVAPETGGVCGTTFGSSATVNTGSDGKARVCWRLGTTAGANSVRATPSEGGDALDGVDFVPPSFVFAATANPPWKLAFGQQPSNTTAGNAISAAPTVIVQDVNGVQVPASTDQVTMTLSSNSFAGGSTTQVNAVAGLATFSNLVITTAGTYTLTASATLSNGATSTVSQSFVVSAAAAAAIKTYLPLVNPIAAQTYSYGSGLTPYVAVSPAPRSRVTDVYGNPVGAGTAVYWSANTTTGAVLDVGSGGQTAADGTAQVNSWTLGEGAQQLLASLYSDTQTPPAGFLPAQFTASTPTGVVIFSCGVGASKVDLGPFTIPAPNSILKDITLQMSVTGQSSSFSAYQASLSVRLDSYNGTELGTGSGVVTLPGNNGNPTAVTFHLAGTGVARQTGTHTLWFRLTVTLPPTRKIQLWYNSSFPNNSACKDAKVYSPTYPSPSNVIMAGLSFVATN